MRRRNVAAGAGKQRAGGRRCASVWLGCLPGSSLRLHSWQLGHAAALSVLVWHLLKCMIAPLPALRWRRCCLRLAVQAGGSRWRQRQVHCKPRSWAGGSAGAAAAAAAAAAEQLGTWERLRHRSCQPEQRNWLKCACFAAGGSSGIGLQPLARQPTCTAPHWRSSLCFISLLVKLHCNCQPAALAEKSVQICSSGGGAVWRQPVGASQRMARRDGRVV